MTKIYSEMVDKKCGGCNWEASYLYGVEGVDIKKDGLCSNCMIDWIVEEKAEVTGLKA